MRLNEEQISVLNCLWWQWSKNQTKTHNKNNKHTNNNNNKTQKNQPTKQKPNKTKNTKPQNKQAKPTSPYLKGSQVSLRVGLYDVCFMGVGLDDSVLEFLLDLSSVLLYNVLKQVCCLGFLLWQRASPVRAAKNHNSVNVCCPKYVWFGSVSVIHLFLLFPPHSLRSPLHWSFSCVCWCRLSRCRWQHKLAIFQFFINFVQRSFIEVVVDFSSFALNQDHMLCF